MRSRAVELKGANLVMDGRGLSRVGEERRMTNILANSLMAAAANSDLIYASRVSSVQHSHRSHTKVL